MRFCSVSTTLINCSWMKIDFLSMYARSWHGHRTNWKYVLECSWDPRRYDKTIIKRLGVESLLTRDEKKFLVHSRSDNGLRCTRFTFLNSCRLILTTSRSYCVTDLYRINHPVFNLFTATLLRFFFSSFYARCPRCYLSWNKNSGRNIFLIPASTPTTLHFFTMDHGNIFASVWIEVTRSEKENHF